MFSRIVVPLDGSEASHAALEYAAAIPSEAVRLIAVIDVDNVTDWLGRERRTHRKEAEAAADRMLETAAEPFQQQGRTVDLVVEVGDPATRILEQLDNADLVVMATRGYGAGRRALYGSVADRIVRHAPVPALMVRGGERPVETAPIQRLVVPLDGSERAERALPSATALAETLGVPVLLIRALDVESLREAVAAGASAASTYAASLETVRHAESEYLAKQAQRLRNRSIPVAIDVRDGDPVSEVAAVVRPGDVIVMTTHGRGGVSRWLLGSVAEKLVRHAEAPVLLIRAGGPEPGKQ